MKDLFTKTERQVIELVAKGLSNKEVGENLGVSQKTIKFHLTNIFKKCGLKSRTQLLVKHYEGTLRPKEPEGSA